MNAFTPFLYLTVYVGNFHLFHTSVVGECMLLASTDNQNVVNKILIDVSNGLY